MSKISLTLLTLAVLVWVAAPAHGQGALNPSPVEGVGPMAGGAESPGAPIGQWEDEGRSAVSDEILVSLEIAIPGTEAVRVRTRANQLVTYEDGDIAFGLIPDVLDRDLGEVSFRVLDLERHEGSLKLSGDENVKVGLVGHDLYAALDSRVIQVKVADLSFGGAPSTHGPDLVVGATVLELDPTSLSLAAGGCCLGCSGPLVCGCSVTMSCGSCDQCDD